jgi:MerR family mercuric resistance operon transcriptional regulator
MAAMTISGLARAGGVGVETVRFYQRRGLIDAPGPAGGVVRRYDGEHVRRLRFIRAAQRAGFTLEQIGALLRLDASDDRDRVRAIARERLAALDTRIAELTAARAWLGTLERECAHVAAGPCPILAAFEAQATGIADDGATG